MCGTCIEADFAHIARAVQILAPYCQFLRTFFHKLGMQTEGSAHVFRSGGELLIAWPSARCCCHCESKNLLTFALLYGCGMVSKEIEMAVKIDESRCHWILTTALCVRRLTATPPLRGRACRRRLDRQKMQGGR
jgi:hypothetical protein